MAERTTEFRTASHRRLVVRAIITGLESVFDSNYDRDRQFRDLKITPQYPLVKDDYPCVVVEYEPQRVVNAGVGHEEWFTDEQNILRKWNHSRFEGTITFEIYALSPLDRDILADAIEEVVRFGRLDSELIPFFHELYGDSYDGQPVTNTYAQLMFNSDEMTGGGNNASPAPWQPEDQLTYMTSLSSEIHGGIYNVIPQDTWSMVTRADAASYPEFEEQVVLPFGDPDKVWTNPFIHEDENGVRGAGEVSSTDDKDTSVIGHAQISGVEVFT